MTTPTPGEDVVRLREDILRLAGEYADSNRNWSGPDVFKWVNLTSKVDALAALAAGVSLVPPEPVAWQWRRKGEPWRMDCTFNMEVFATTPDSEVRALYALSPPIAE
jgi:hypothetical protein